MSFDNDASYIIDSVKVCKLWNKYNINCKFEKDINIFIGINGSYKTTFIKLINNLLTLDFIKLIDVEFESIELKLRKGRLRQCIIFSVSMDNYNEKQYTFEIVGFDKISLTEHELKLYGKNIFEGNDIDNDDYENLYMVDDSSSSSILRSQYCKLKNELSKYINVDYLNVNRYSIIRQRNFYFDRDSNTIDKEIRKLVEQFIRYQSEMKTQINDLSNEFLKKAFEMLLKENKFSGKLSLKLEDISSYKDFLLRMSKDNTFRGVNFADSISVIDEVKSILQNFDKSRSKQKVSNREFFDGLNPEQHFKVLTYLTFSSKLQSLYALYNETEKRKLSTEEPKNIFLTICNEFLKSNMFPDKKLVIMNDGSLRLQILEGHTVGLTKLSSGEKQLLILLLRTLLQRGKTGVYITDEPELSLHILWQEKLISALTKINPNIQLVLATHSPDIVAQYDNKIKQMEDILK